jgi:class 3 adenylate cyclase
MEISNAQRRLATILATDAVGYSALMAQDEEGTVRTLRSHREVIDNLITRHEGRIFNTAGDAVLAEFGSVVEAVRCAISIQEELRVRNAELAEEQKMLFRIGINVGDVLVNGDDLLGDGVNIAARLEGIAQPGGICISGSTFEQVKNKLSIGFNDLGPQQVKNIPEPIAAFGLTSAPVVVADSADTVDKASSKTLIKTRGNFRIAFCAVAFVLLGGLGFWQFAKVSVVPLTSFPENISTKEMTADEIIKFMAGMTIIGIRRFDGLPFTIELNADMTANYEFPRKGELTGTVQQITGEWRTEDSRFCMQLAFFAKGREVCLWVEKNGSKLTMFSKKSGQKKWSLSKKDDFWWNILG